MTKIIVLIFHLVLFPSLYLSQSFTLSLLFDVSHYATQGAALFGSDRSPRCQDVCACVRVSV